MDSRIEHKSNSVSLYFARGKRKTFPLCFTQPLIRHLPQIAGVNSTADQEKKKKREKLLTKVRFVCQILFSKSNSPHSSLPISNHLKLPLTAAFPELVFPGLLVPPKFWRTWIPMFGGLSRVPLTVVSTAWSKLWGSWLFQIFTTTHHFHVIPRKLVLAQHALR